MMMSDLRVRLIAAFTMRLQAFGVELQPGNIASLADDAEQIISAYSSNPQSDATTDDSQTPDPPEGE